MKKVTNVVLTALPLIAITSCVQQQQKPKPKPNVILLVADDLGYGDISCYGAHRVATPNVDKIANEGILFTDAHAVASTSTPSRYSILTGEYSWRKKDTNIAAGDASMIIKPNQYTIADMFKSKGYATAAIGKWHLGIGAKRGQQDWNNGIKVGLDDIGFDYSYIMAATGDRVPCVFIENSKIANFDPANPIEVSYKKNFEGEPTGKKNPELLTKLTFSKGQGHDQSIVHGISRIGYMKGGGKALWEDENIADSITKHALDFITNEKDNPFFLYLCTNDVHVPRYPADRFRGKSPMGLRGDAILEFDWIVGQVEAKLKELNLDENTIIIVTSDNGPVLDDGYNDKAVALCGDHKPSGPFRGGKYSTFEAGTCVPFIVKWPGKTAVGTKSDALVSHIDLYASLTDLVGGELPEGAAPDSRNYMNTYLGKDKVGRNIVIEQSVNRTLSIKNKQWKYIVPSNGYKYAWGTMIETGYNKKPQLFDLKKSLWEGENVAEKNPEKLKEMKDLLEKVEKDPNFDKK